MVVVLLVLMFLLMNVVNVGLDVHRYLLVMLLLMLVILVGRTVLVMALVMLAAKEEEERLRKGCCWTFQHIIVITAIWPPLDRWSISRAISPGKLRRDGKAVH